MFEILRHLLYNTTSKDNVLANRIASHEKGILYIVHVCQKISGKTDWTAIQLEAPWQGTSNEYPNIYFCGE